MTFHWGPAVSHFPVGIVNKVDKRSFEYTFYFPYLHSCGSSFILIYNPHYAYEEMEALREGWWKERWYNSTVGKNYCTINQSPDFEQVRSCLWASISAFVKGEC